MQLSYTYHSVPIPGGGFVTGFVFHPTVPDILYARTDVGGLYRFDFNAQRWIPLMDWVGHPNEGLMQTLSIALDPARPGRIMVLAGNATPKRRAGRPQKSAFLLSEDYGKSWKILDVPFAVNGNGPSRSCAEKLAYVNHTLYYASPNEGLFMSDDLGESWRAVPVPNPHLVFVKADPQGRWLLISSTGEPAEHDSADQPRTGVLADRAHSLYISLNGGAFMPLPMPVWQDDALQSPRGYVAMSCAVSETAGGQALYVTFSGAGQASPTLPYWNFCCECGGGTHGKLLRYTLKADAAGKITLLPQTFEDLTPDIPADAGLCGVAVHDSMVLCSTVNKEHNYIYRSMDGGAHFARILYPPDTDICDYTVPYMKPRYNNGVFLVHWMSCLMLNPFDPDFLLFNTGTGCFCTYAIRSAHPRFLPLCDGMEETVHLNLYAPPAGNVRLLDIVGDLGGFAFYDIAVPCENSFANKKGDRYITCNNADYTDKAVSLEFDGQTYTDVIPYVSTARGNWRGVTKGGLILSLDGCESFIRLPMPFGMSAELDRNCRRIEEPNVNAGWCALSADAKTLLWTPARDWFHLPAALAVYTADWGAHYEFVKIFDLAGKAITPPQEASSEPAPEIKFFSDRVNPDWFYGFGETGQIYISTDGGHQFYEHAAPPDFPKGFYFSGVDNMNCGEIRVEPYRAGSIYVAADAGGLWHLTFDGKTLSGTRISAENDIVFKVGLGKGSSPQMPALFIAGCIDQTYGFFTKPSAESPWLRINTDQQQFGAVSCIIGDMNRAGIVYIATGGRGILCGTPAV